MIANTVTKLEQPAQFERVDNAMGAARRKLDAAVELLNAFDPSAETLEEAARAIAKVAHRSINPRKNGSDE